MKGRFRRGFPRAGIVLAVTVIVAACVKAEPPTPGETETIGADPNVPGAEAWLIEPSAFKSAGVRTSCTLARVAENPQRATDYFGPDEGVALSDEEARRLHGCAKAAMAATYSKAGLAAAVGYQAWTNYATTPYVSATHAQRYVNNYANEIASNYKNYESVGALPVGAVVVKDSLSVSPDGRVTIGPLFMMEKVAHVAGTRFPSPWRFTMVMPEGWVFGTTGGPGDANVAFCADCHGAVADTNDSLYFLPPQYRR